MDKLFNNALGNERSMLDETQRAHIMAGPSRYSNVKRDSQHNFGQSSPDAWDETKMGHSIEKQESVGLMGRESDLVKNSIGASGFLGSTMKIKPQRYADGVVKTAERAQFADGEDDIGDSKKVTLVNKSNDASPAIHGVTTYNTN